MSGKTKGILLMLISTLSYSIMSILVKLTASRIGIYQQMFFRNLFGIIIVFFTISKSEKFDVKEIKKNWKGLLLRSILGTIALYFSFKADSVGIQGTISALKRINPLFVVLFSKLFLKDKVPKNYLPAILLACSGIFLIMNNYSLGSIESLLAAIGCALFSGAAYTVLSYFKGKINSDYIVFCFSLTTSIIFFPIMIATYVSPTLLEWCGLFGIGIFATIGQITMSRSYQCAKAGIVSFWDNWGVLFSMILGLIILQETYNVWMIIGTILIVTSSIIISIKK